MRLTAYVIGALILGGCDGSPGSDRATGNSAADNSELTIVLDPPRPYKKPASRSQPPRKIGAEPAPAPPAESAPPPAEPDARKPKEEPKPPPAEPTKPAASAKKERAAGDGAGEVALRAARPPLAEAEIARTIDRIGFACGKVVSSYQVEKGGEGGPIYKIGCASGESYQATTKNGRLFFRPWTGKLDRN